MERRAERSSRRTRDSISGQMGHRPAVGARALSDRKIREEAGRRDEPPKGHQGLLHAFERRRLVAAMDVLAPGIGEIIGGSQREERLEVLDQSRPSAASTRTITPGTAIYAATARCRMPALASALSAHWPTSPALPMCATRFLSRARRATHDIDSYCLRRLSSEGARPEE